MCGSYDFKSEEKEQKKKKGPKNEFDSLILRMQIEVQQNLL